MRYFLPVLPPTAILSAFAIGKITENRKNKRKRFFVLAVLAASSLNDTINFTS